MKDDVNIVYHLLREKLPQKLRERKSEIGGMGPAIAELIGEIWYSMIPERMRILSRLPPLLVDVGISGLDTISR